MNRVRERANRAKLLRCNTLICVLENPIDDSNIGAVIRNIDALGIGKLYVVSTRFSQEIFSRKKCGKKNTKMHTISVSALKYVYVRVFTSSNECMQHLRQKKFISAATSSELRCKTITSLDHDFTKYKKLAIWFGNESSGLSKDVLDEVSICIQIQMCGIVQCLNLAVCTGIVLHALAQQRRLKVSTDKKFLNNHS
jgi:tRNA (guanosine-2'-O-)-methyltransferase